MQGFVMQMQREGARPWTSFIAGMSEDVFLAKVTRSCPATGQNKAAMQRLEKFKYKNVCLRDGGFTLFKPKVTDVFIYWTN